MLPGNVGNIASGLESGWNEQEFTLMRNWILVLRPDPKIGRSTQPGRRVKD